MARPEHPKPKPDAPTAHEVRLTLHEVEVDAKESPVEKAEREERKEPLPPARKVKRQEPDVATIVTSADAMVEAFLQERRDAELPLPDKQDILDRIAHLARSVSLTAGGGINSAAENQRFYLVHKDAPPYFGVGTGK